MSAHSVQIVEVSARDGLQNEQTPVDTDSKLQLIRGAIDAGIRRLEIASFVNPKRVPQMADAEAVIAGAPRRDDLTYIGLVMNRRGAERALDTDVHQLGAISVCTDTFAGKNQGQTALESVDGAAALVRLAAAAGRQANVTLGAAFGCPFEGEVPIDRVVDFARRIADAGPVEIAVADTIGVANPWHVEDLLSALRAALPDMPLRAHFHNTRNTGLANAYAAVRCGVAAIDASVGGLGGCPFAPAATGNIGTEDVVYMLERGGVQTGVNLDALIELAGWLSGVVGRPLPAMVSRAGGFGERASAA